MTPQDDLRILFICMILAGCISMAGAFYAVHWMLK